MVNRNVFKRKDTYQFKKILDSGIIASFSNRKLDLGFYHNSLPRLKRNRQLFLKKINIDYQDLVCPQQVHKNKVVYVDYRHIGRGALDYGTAIPNADALITDKKNLPLAVFTADCLSLFLYDRKHKAIGLIHSGWRSARNNIAKKTIDLMRKKFHTQTKDLLVAFGPAIRSCCYEVTGEMKKYFPDSLIARNDKLYLDLVGVNLTQLRKIGVKKQNIIDTGICTACQNQAFFSYRKEGPDAGRIMSVMMLK
jgi:YfiH family protein